MLDVPPLSRHELSQAIRLRLRAEYPGNGETEVDWRSMGHGQPGRVVVVAMREDRLAEYRRLAGRRKLLSSVEIAESIGRGVRNRIVIAAFDGRILVVAFQDGAIAAVQRSSPDRVVADLKRLIERWSEQPDLFLTGPDAEAIAGRLDNADLHYEVADLGRAVRSALRSTHGLFRPEPKIARYTLRGVAAISVVAAVTLLVLGLLKWRSAIVDARAEVSAALAQARAEYARYAELSREMEDLAEVLATASTPPAHPYVTLSAVTGAMQGYGQIESITIRGYAFEMTTLTAGYVSLLERFQDDPSIASVQMRQNLRDTATGQDRVVLVGTVYE
jgi:hypothetical protein